MVTLGNRTLLAASCLRCGKLYSGKTFDWRVRNMRDRHPYIDQRCVDCKWGTRRKGGPR